MSLLGVDIGTTGCKASAFALDGTVIAAAYREYDVQSPEPGHAQLDSERVWDHVKEVIREVASLCAGDPVAALSVSSLGEAVVPVTEDRGILGPSILNFDGRGAEYLEALRERIQDEDLYRINGNTLGNHYTLTKLLWIRDHEPDLYARTYKFLHWGAFASFMLGAEPSVDYALANRTLLFDVDRETWSDELLADSGIDPAKLPETVPCGSAIGEVSGAVAKELGLPPKVAIVSGAHDQCANAVGCGVIDEGRAMFGMGTYICIVPVFSERRDASVMMDHGLNTEHHAVPGRYVCFLYNHGGSMLKWYRDTFAAAERADTSIASGRSIYDTLIGEIPDAPSGVVVLPHFSATGPPEFLSDSSGVMAGLRLETQRGDILKGILEGAVLYLRECLEPLPSKGIAIQEFRAVGGGSRSDAWLQIAADILGKPLTRAALAEAGALGGAILAGAATGAFDSVEEGVAAMVRLDRTFEPDPKQLPLYDLRYEQYHRLWPLMRDYLRNLRS